MLMHHTEHIQTKLGKTYEMRNFTAADGEALQNFFRQSALDSTHTLHYKERPISIAKLQERINSSLESPSDLFIGVFNQDYWTALFQSFSPRSSLG